MAVEITVAGTIADVMTGDAAATTVTVAIMIATETNEAADADAKKESPFAKMFAKPHVKQYATL